MELKLERSTVTEICSIGQLQGVDFECWILEPADINPVHPGHPRIVPGRYKIIKRMESHRLQDEHHKNHRAKIQDAFKAEIAAGVMTETTVPELIVEGRSSIEQHPGNIADHTEGCQLPGLSKTKEMVMRSTDAFILLLKNYLPAWKRGEEIWITITEKKE